jgi:DNA polymerase III subunit epsilon
VLYVGKSNDLRTRVKSYFYGDERKKVEHLLAEVRAVDGIPCAGELEALVVEARMIRLHEPPYNRRGKGWRKGTYLKLDPSEAYPRLKIVRAATSDDGCRYLGPFPSSARARDVKDALETLIPIRRCSTAMGVRTRFAACALADMGRCLAPCDGRTTPERYGELVRGLVSSLTASPGGLLEALEGHMDELAAQERYEQAALVRDRLRALAAALHRDRQDAWIVGAGRLEVSASDGSVCRFDGGSLVTTRSPEGPIPLPCPRERAAELGAVRSWLARHPGAVMTAEIAPHEPIEGGAAIARILAQQRRSERDD